MMVELVAHGHHSGETLSVAVHRIRTMSDPCAGHALVHYWRQIEIDEIERLARYRAATCLFAREMRPIQQCDARAPCLASKYAA
jgi:hypothetical protein